VNAFYTIMESMNSNGGYDHQWNDRFPKQQLRYYFTRCVRNRTCANQLVNRLPTINPRSDRFYLAADVKNDTRETGSSGVSNRWDNYDPWGTPYLIEIDGGTTMPIANPYTANAAGTESIHRVNAWSLGKDQSGATTAPA